MAKTFKELVDTTLDSFRIIERGDDNIVVLKDEVAEVPEALRDSVRIAHGERFPSNWIFKTYYRILEALATYDLADVITDDQGNEIVNGLVDVYTHDLTSWLNEDVRNVHYLGLALDDIDVTAGKDNDGVRLLALAQYKAIDEIYEQVETYLNEQIQNN